METSPKFKELTATYYITAHGTMITTGEKIKEYYAITIPQNVELYTFTDIGKSLKCDETEIDLICDYNPDKNKNILFNPRTPAFRFKYEDGKENKFPELLLLPDNEDPKVFYSGIIHCIPDKSSLRPKEVIYNIDAKSSKNCDPTKIISIKSTPYDYAKNYSTDYNELLQNPKIVANKCGPILLNEAIVIIQLHCKKHYRPGCIAQIYISTCLREESISTKFIDFYNKSKSDNSDKDYYNASLDKLEDLLLSELYSKNTVNSLEQFKGIPLINHPILSMHIFKHRNKIFLIKTLKDAFMIFTRKEVSEVGDITKLERTNMTLSQHKLLKCVQDALKTFALPDDRNEIDILPRFNTINLALPNAREPGLLTEKIRTQIRTLIDKEVRNLEQDGGKKTLRKKPKKTNRKFTFRSKKQKKTKYIRKYTRQRHYTR
uniref:Uncharacterized protein n=1 Tax=viral metagenome TaxID=1070528 RepID=A0A6C0DVM4_9ZZZZ